MENKILNVRTEYQKFSTDVLKKIQNANSKNVSVLLFNVRTDGNIGMIIRQACIMGCKEIIICGKRQYDRRFTVGSHNYIKVTHWESPLKVNVSTISPGIISEKIEYNVEEFIKLVNNFTPVFLEQGGKDIREIPWKLVENPLLILGNESVGIPKDFINAVKQKVKCECVSIPQYSVLRSMNVAIAGSIALWELIKN
jgi:tRNA G18 (ribose-2'-O)-methylase SpoU